MFPGHEHPSDVEICLQDGVVVLVRVGTFGATVELSPEEARQLGRALEDLVDKDSKSPEAVSSGLPTPSLSSSHGRR